MEAREKRRKVREVWDGKEGEEGAGWEGGNLGYHWQSEDAFDLFLWDVNGQGLYGGDVIFIKQGVVVVREGAVLRVVHLREVMVGETQC